MAEQVDGSHPDLHASNKNQEVEEYDFSFLGNTETRMQRLGRKVRENPLVPLGELCNDERHCCLMLIVDLPVSWLYMAINYLHFYIII